jgi:hypothetical protein
VLHHGVEERLTCREVDVDRCADDAGAASDLRHAAVGIARQRFEGGVEDGGDTAFGSPRTSSKNRPASSRRMNVSTNGIRFIRRYGSSFG